MTNYELLRHRINELLPDRVKLEFGCEVVWQGKRGFVCWLPEDGTVSTTTFSNVKPEELDKGGVLGKPLEVSDILRALGDRKVYVSLGGNIVVFWESEKAYRYYLGPKDRGRLFDVVLNKPLSAPENDAACSAALELLK